MLTTTFFSFLLPAALVFAAPVRFAPVKRAVEIDGAKAYEPDRYIVALKTNTVDPNNRKEWLTNVLASADLNIATVPESTLKTGWNADIFNGLSGTFTAAELKAIQSQPEVDWIAEDLEMRTLAIVQQTNAPWGIARFSTGEQSFAGNDPTLLQFPFTFDDAAVGAGTDVYIIDTGIRTTHQDFGGRASFLASFGTGVVGQDINGHGTHCAGSAAGNVFGIAKEANILAVKVMADDGSGATSDIISGIVASFDNFSQTGRPSVASMSLGGPINQAIDQAVAAAVAGGLPFVVAAGNETQDAENVSPARLPEAITVGATDINDNIAFFSNFGPAVDVFAPGDIIPSAGQNDDLQVVNLSGTSMACPQVAGLALTILGQNPGLTPAQLKDAIVGASVNNVIANLPGGTANQLASNGV